jgi:hypothetical protein
MTAKMLAAAPIVAMVIAACGTTMLSTSSASGEDAQALAYASCMRAHGATDFPDPISGHKAQFPDSPVFSSHAPAVLAAEQACKAQQAALIGTSAGPSTNQNAALRSGMRRPRPTRRPT